jgi:hypothetical protein
LQSENPKLRLLGSKPITLIILNLDTEEETQIYLKSLSEKEIKNCRIVENYDLPENWEKWERISARFPIKRYLLFKSDREKVPDASFVYFVDILKTATTIQNNYALFRDAVGFDFNPLQAVLEMPNKESKFWENIQGKTALWGLLFGYGRTNSFAFEWKYFSNLEVCQNFFKSLPCHFSKEPMHGKVEISLKNFKIPSFISFETNDETIEQYKEEREKIRKTYEGKNLLEFTLKKLTS